MKRKIVACCLLGFLASYVGCSPSNESGGSGANSSDVENFAGYTTYEDQEPRDGVAIQAGEVAAENRRFFCNPDDPSDSTLCGRTAAEIKDACDAVESCLSFLFIRLVGGGQIYAERYTDLVRVKISPEIDYYTKDEPQE